MRRAGPTRPERGPQEPTGFTQEGDQRMMRGATAFLRIVANLTAFLSAVATEDGGVQVQGVPQQKAGHARHALSQQGFRHHRESGIGEGQKEAAERVGGRETGQAESLREQGVASIPSEMGKAFGSQGEAIEPG